MLGCVEYVDAENNETITDTVNKFISLNNIKYRDIISTSTDNVEKNTVAVTNLKNSFNKYLLHVRCSNHVVNLILECIINHDFFDYCHEFLSHLLE